MDKPNQEYEGEMKTSAAQASKKSKPNIELENQRAEVDNYDNLKCNISVTDIKKEANKEEDLSGELSNCRRKQIFILFLLANLFLNYDTGVIPASLLEIIKEIDLDYKEQALLGSLVYLGLSFASLFVAPLFIKFPPSKVCACVLVLNTFCCFIFSLSKIKFVLFGARFLMGISEAFIVIYGPVWVNNYSPKEHSAKWMGILHSCTALGVICGYLVAGISINFFRAFVSWRFAIQVQGIAEIPIALYFYFEKEEYINVDITLSNAYILDTSFNLDDITLNASIHNASLRTPDRSRIIPPTPKDASEGRNNVRPTIYSFHRQSSLSVKRGKSHAYLRRESRIDAVETSNLGNYCAQAKLVITNALYITVTLGLCSMYFIVTGIQFWMTSYLIDILEYNPIQVVIVFSLTSITAPLAGVIVGGVFADKYGGYRGKNTLKALKLCCAFGFISFVFAFPLGFLYSLVYITVLLWTFLFFGAAIIPVSTGIMICSVRRDCQATSSSISQLIFNFFGYFLAPILTGFLMDRFDNKREGYTWGMRVIFWWVIFALIFMSSAWIIAYRKYKSGDQDEKDLMEDEMNQDMGDLMKIEIMRRMAQSSI